MTTPGRLLVAFLVLASVQYAYRYILRMSDHATSPGYSNTPLLISGAKALLLILPLVVVLTTRRRALRERKPWLKRYALLLGVGLAAQLAAFLSQMARGLPLINVVYALWYFWLYPIVGLVLAASISARDARRAVSAFAFWMFLIAFGYWLVEVFLYLAHGRLPALSYPGAPRFGSVLDDPNGFAVLVVLLYAIHLTFRTRLRYLSLPVLAIMLFATFSLSGYVVFVAFILFAVAVRSGSWPRSRVLWAVAPSLAAIVVAAAVLLATPATSGPVAIARGKVRSVEIHLADLVHPWREAQRVGTGTVLFGAGAGGSETLYWQLLDKNGLMVMLLFSAAAIGVSWRGFRSRDALFANLGAWGVSVLIGSLFVPYLQVYPINCYFWTLLLLAPTPGRRADA